AYIGPERQRVGGPLEDQGAHHPVAADGRDQGSGLPTPLRRATDHPSPAGGAAVQPGQGRVRADLVQKHETIPGGAGHPATEGRPLVADVRPLLFGGVHHFFFTVQSSRASARAMVLRWTGAARRSRSSARVASGCSVTSTSKRRRRWSVILGLGPPAW